MSLHITLNDIAPCLLGNTVLTTLTNHGYLLYTLNMLKSLRPFGLDKKILIVAELPKTRSGKIMRRLLRDVAENRSLGDVTTLADPTVMNLIGQGLSTSSDSD